MRTMTLERCTRLLSADALVVGCWCLDGGCTVVDAAASEGARRFSAKKAAMEAYQAARKGKGPVKV